MKEKNSYDNGAVPNDFFYTLLSFIKNVDVIL